MPNWLKASRLYASVAILATLTGSAFAQDIVPGRLIVKFKDGVSNARKQEVLKGHSASLKSTIDPLGVMILSIPENASPEAVAARMKHEDGVEFAEPDRIVHPCQTPSYKLPNDPYFGSYQWGLHKIGCPYAWAITTGNASIVIAVLDSGVQTTNPDLSAQMLAGWNVVSNSSDVTDTLGHGTAVAGVLGASSNNGVGVTGVAWNCKVMPIKVANSQNTVLQSSVDSGLTWAADHGARVANVSLLLTPDSALASAANYFRSKGGVVVTGSGNSGTNTALPDSYYMMTVGGTDSDDTVDPTSSFGNNVDIAAPIIDWTTSINSSTYQSASGTSIATPFVSGAAALVLSINPNLTPDQVTSILETTSVDLGTPGWDMYFGWGRLNVYAAVQKAQASLSTDTTPPTVSFTSPAAGSTVSGTVSVYANAADNNVVDSVTFYIDGIQNVQCLTSPYVLTWDTTKVADGTHTIKAVATDGAKNVSVVGMNLTVSNGDTVPPTVSLTAPVNSTSLSGSVSLSALAADNVAVASVTFSVDGAQIGQDVAAPYTLSWNSTSVGNGAHTITATAVDSAGNSATSSVSVTVNNGDTTAPTVTLTAPSNGSGLAGVVTITATAADNVGVVSVSFYCDGALVATDTASPYFYNWDTTTVADGAHTLSAIGKDAAGNSATSSVNVTVSNTATPSTVDSSPPSISIMSPSSGSTVGKAGLKVTVNALDNVGVVRVELYLDGKLAATSSSSPWSCSVGSKSLSAGSHSVYCKAYDAAGNVGTSQTITVTK